MKKVTSTGNYILMADIDLSGQEWTPLRLFTGVFDGNGHKISNMTISDPDLGAAGLFASVGGGAIIKNLALEDVNISTSGSAGGIVARRAANSMDEEIVFSNCYVTGTINHTNTTSDYGIFYIGGIAGNGDNISFSDCYTKININVEGYEDYTIGGIAGTADVVSNCYVFDSQFFAEKIDLSCFGGIVGSGVRIAENCHVKNTDINLYGSLMYSSIGGVIGSFQVELDEISKFQNCSISDSSIFADEGILGGIVGRVYAYSEVDTAFCMSGLYANNTDLISHSDRSSIGGLVGEIDFDDNASSLTNSYFIDGNITAASSKGVGGLVGNIAGAVIGDVDKDKRFTVSNSFVTGTIIGKEKVGGLVGNAYANIENSFFKGTLSGVSSVGGLAGYISNDIANSYSSAVISRGSDVGGITGSGGNITNSYWDKELSNVIDAYAAEGSIDSVSKGATTAEMKDPATYAGWDETIWNLNTGDTPTLKWYEDLLDQDTTDPVDPNPGGDGGDGGTDPVDPNPGGDGGDGGTDPDGDGNDGSDTDDPDDDKPNTGGGTAPDTGCDVEVDKDFETGAGKGNVRLQIGAGSNPDTNAIYVDLTFDIDGFFADMTDPDKCLETVEKVDELQSRVKSKQAELGAVLNRLDSVMNTQLTQIENNTAAYSTVMDTDIAQETVNYVKAQIQTQTASSLTIQTRNFYVQIMLNLINSIG